jgi:hypothetical protein
MPKMIKLNDRATAELNKLKVKYEFTTYSNCIEEMAHFFLKSGISPMDYDIDKNFITLTDFVKRKIDQLQARNTAVEKEYFLGFRKDINILKEHILKNIKKNLDENIDSSETESKLENEILKLNKNIKSNSENHHLTIEDYKKTIEGLKTDRELLFKNLKRFDESLKKDSKGNIIAIDLEKKEVENLFSILKNFK